MAEIDREQNVEPDGEHRGKSRAILEAVGVLALIALVYLICYLLQIFRW